MPAPIVVLVSFVALTIGFVAGSQLAPGDREETSAVAGTQAPHAVGPAEYVQLGVSALDQGDARTAEGYFRTAIGLDATNSGAHADLSVALMAQARWEEAQAAIETARRLEPGRYEYLFLEGVLARDGFGDTLRARELWSEFLESAPEDSPQARVVREWMGI